MNHKNMTRREFLTSSAVMAAGIGLAACTPAVPAQPAALPSSSPTSAAAETLTPIPTQAASATPVPTLAQSHYHEAPALAELVKAGKLPPVEERLPKNPLVLAPVDQVGKYGGRMRKMWFAGWNGFFDEEQYGHSPLRWIDDSQGIGPGMCDRWSTNADNSQWTLHVREGLKWSDGQPCTVDDILFWWNDLSQASNPDYPEFVPDFGRDANGSLASFERVDNFTLEIHYGTPAPLTAKQLAMWVKGSIGPRWVAPAHYLKQFLPKYNSSLKDFSIYSENATTYTNPDCPTLNHWKISRYDAGKSFSAERNPYYYAVDPQGNQLPYIDGQDWSATQDSQTQMLMIRQGSIDHAHFHGFSLSDLSTLLDSAETGGYEVYLWDQGDGTGMCFFPNFDYPDDTPQNQAIARLYRSPQFKQALSHALDRAAIQKTVYYGNGFLTTGTMAPKAFEFNFNAEAQDFFKKARDIYVAYNPEKAKALLKEAGYQGEEIRIDLAADPSKDCIQVLEIALKNWEAIGLKVVVNSISSGEFEVLWSSGKGSMHTDWSVSDGPDHLLYPSWMVPNEPERWAPLSGRLLEFAGTPQENTEADKSPWERKPPRFNKNDPQYKGSAVEKLHRLYADAILELDEIQRARLVWQMWQIHMDEGPFIIGTVANTPYPIIKSKKLTNVPTREQLKLGGFTGPWIVPYPAICSPETWSYI